MDVLGPGAPEMAGRGVAVSEEQIQSLIPAARRGTGPNLGYVKWHVQREEENENKYDFAFHVSIIQLPEYVQYI